MEQQTKNSTDWLVGGGEMGALIRATDWSGTPFGPRESWPAAMRGVVNLVLSSQFPMALLWGRELLFLYNDAYRVIAADKHPRALGRSTREIWPEVWHINEPIFAAVLDRGETIYLEDKIFPIDRRGRREDAYFTLCYSPVRDDDGAVAGSLVTLLETTRRVREEEALRAGRNHVAEAAARERELLAGVIEHVPAMLVIYDPHLETFHLNAEARRVLGYTDEDANTGDLMALCYPDPSYREEVRRFMESADPGWRELVVTAKDGSLVTSSWANVRLSDSTQIGIGLDLRERKRAEEAVNAALRAAEASVHLAQEQSSRQQAIIESLPVGLWIADPTGKMEVANEHARRLWGGEAPPSETVAGYEVYRVWWPDSDERVAAEDMPMARALRGEDLRDVTFDYERYDGSRGRLVVSAAPIKRPDGAISGCVGVAQDITDQWRAKQALRDSEEQLRAIYRQTPAMVVLSDLEDGRIVQANEGVTHMLGFPVEEVLGRTPVELGIFPGREDRERLVDLLREKGSVRNLEITVRSKAGTAVTGLLSSTTVMVAGKKRLITVVADITDRKRAEEELRRSEERFRVAVKNAAFIPAQADRDLRYQWIYNPHSDFDSASVLGKRDDELDQSEGSLRLVALKKQVIDTAVGVREEIAFARSDGVNVYDFILEPLRDADGRVIGVTTAAFDITERRRMEEALQRSEERYSFALRSAQTGAWELDLRDNTAERSLEHDRIFGYEQLLPEWTFERFMQHVLPEDREEVERRFRYALEHGTEWKFECRIVRRDGVLRWILATGRAVVDLGGRPIRMAGIVQDISDRKQAEEALRRSQEELKAANATLIEADRRKNEFLALLSHELRNPLAPIRNSVYILEHAVPGGEQASRARQVIERQAQHMARLIDDLLDVTRISRGKITLQREQLDLNAVARGTAEDHRETFVRNGIELEIDVDRDPLWIDGDRTRLAQVIGNLLTNSAKFTPRGGRTILSVDASPAGHAVLRVRDNGAGMSEDTLQHLFEPFVQAAQTLDRTHGGLGLGLALVKGLVEMHGGEITASSEGLGKGSEFTVTLPLQAPAKPRLSEVPAAKPRTIGARRVLVVEDNADAAESLRDALEFGDYEVEVAYSGPQGVEAARRSKCQEAGLVIASGAAKLIAVIHRPRSR